MKRFLRSKLVLTFVAFVMIAAAVTIPLSSSLIRTHAQASATVRQSSSNGPSDKSVAAAKITITSTVGWQQTALTVQQGTQFTISYVSGTWTVDFNNFPYVGPDGYPRI